MIATTTAARGCLLLLLSAGCATATVQPPSGTAQPPQLSRSQRSQYIWEKVLEGVSMGAIAGPYGAGAGLVIGGLMGVLTADAHYAQLNAQVETERAKDKELEAELEREMERQRSLEAEISTADAASAASPAPPTGVSSQPVSQDAAGATHQPGKEAAALASLGRAGPPARPPSNGFRNVEIKDLNHDGTPDLWTYYNPSKPGEIVRQEEDTNLDGTVDSWSSFRDGKLVRREVDTLGSGKPDILYLYENGVISVEERDEHGKGRPTLRAHYQKGRIVRVEKDTDADGKIDAWVHYDPEDDAIVLKEEKDLNGNGSPDLWSFYENGRLARREVTAVGLEYLSGAEGALPVLGPTDPSAPPKS